MIHISQTSLLQSLGTASQFRLLHAAKTLGGERQRVRLMRHSRRIRRAREEGWVGVREQAKERARENECFSLSLATVGGVRLQPVVFSLTHTDAHLCLSLLLQLSCLSACWTPGCLLTFFPQMVFLASPSEMKAAFQG